MEKLPRNNARRLLTFLKQIKPMTGEEEVHAIIRLGDPSLVIDDVDNPFRDKLQVLFDWLGPDEKKGLVGQRFASLDESKEVAKALQALMNRYGFRVKCPKVGCGAAASITSGTGGGVKSGTFKFHHQTNGLQDTHGGLVKLPSLEVIFAPLLPSRSSRSRG